MRFPNPRLLLLSLAGAVTITITVIVMAGPGCQSPERRGDTGAPVAVEVVLLGLDGASFDLLEPMMERGALPNLKRLVEGGVSARMRSDMPCLSIVLWTSVATGKLPETHGIKDWSYLDPETGEKGLMNSDRRRVEAVWNIATRADRSVGFVSWWASWPAEPVDGYIVSEQFTRAGGLELARGTFPEGLAEELRGPLSGDEWPWLRATIASGGLKVLSDRDAASGALDSSSPPGDRDDRYRQAWFLYGQDYQSERALFHLLRHRSRPALLGYLSRKVDVASHYMWQFAPDSGSRPDTDTISRLLEPVYRYEDHLLGRLLAEVGPEANIVILSDHGFGWETEGFGHEETAPDGIFIAHGPAFARGRRLSSVRLYDVLPVVLHALSLPLARDLDGTLPEGLFRSPTPPRYVDSYETPGGRQPETGATRSPLEERILQELRALGYVP